MIVDIPLDTGRSRWYNRINIYTFMEVYHESSLV